MPMGVGDIDVNAIPGNMQGLITANEISKGALENRMNMLKNQYYPTDIQSQINNRNALTQGQNITNKYLPEHLRLANTLDQQKFEWNPRNWQSENSLRQAQAHHAQKEAEKINFMLKNPAFMGGDVGKELAALKSLGANIDFGNQPSYGSNTGSPNSTNNLNVSPVSGGNVSPIKTGNPFVDTLLNRKFAKAAYTEKMAQGYNWNHLPVETRNQLVSQGYGMGIEPLKMMQYVNQGYSLPQIAKLENLDPDNLPAPIYPPTTATKTRTQQVEQVGKELDYLSSAATALIKPFANTFAGISGQRLSDMMSNDPEAQKRFGRYIGALSIQSGIANGRVLLEGGRAGLEVMRMVKDGALQGIDQHSPIKMTDVAFEEAQKTIDNLLQRGAKIRTTTGMNPMSEISKSKAKYEEQSDNKSKSEDKSEKVIRIVRDKYGNLVRASQ